MLPIPSYVRWQRKADSRFPTLRPVVLPLLLTAALAMRLGAEAVFVGSGIFKSKDPLRTAKAIVHATAHFEDAAELANASRSLGEGCRESMPASFRKRSAFRIAAGKPWPCSGRCSRPAGICGTPPQIPACCGCGTHRSQKPAELEGITHLVIPGGESTTLHHLLKIHGLDQQIPERVRAGSPSPFGHLRRSHPDGQESGAGSTRFELIDVDVDRNAYGRQIHSFVGEVEWQSGPGPGTGEGVFIRAPKFVRIGEEVNVIARREDEVVAVQQGRCVACASTRSSPPIPASTAGSGDLTPFLSLLERAFFLPDCDSARTHPIFTGSGTADTGLCVHGKSFRFRDGRGDFDE